MQYIIYQFVTMVSVTQEPFTGDLNNHLLVVEVSVHYSTDST